MGYEVHHMLFYLEKVRSSDLVFQRIVADITTENDGIDVGFSDRIYDLGSRYETELRMKVAYE